MSKLDDILELYRWYQSEKGTGARDYLTPFQAKQQIKDLIRHDIIKAYSSYPSHYKVEDVLADQLTRVDNL